MKQKWIAWMALLVQNINSIYFQRWHGKFQKETKSLNTSSHLWELRQEASATFEMLHFLFIPLCSVAFLPSYLHRRNLATTVYTLHQHQNSYPVKSRFNTCMVDNS